VHPYFDISKGLIFLVCVRFVCGSTINPSSDDVYMCLFGSLISPLRTLCTCITNSESGLLHRCHHICSFVSRSAAKSTVLSCYILSDSFSLSRRNSSVFSASSSFPFNIPLIKLPGVQPTIMWYKPYIMCTISLTGPLSL
jgi:hypothetical protein